MNRGSQRTSVVNGLRGRPARLVRAAAEAWSLPVLHLYLVWAITLFDVQFFLAAVVAQPLVYLVYLGYPPLLLMMFLQGPTILVTAKRWVWYPPLFVLLLISAITTLLAVNKMLAKLSFQYILIFYSVALATALYIRTARQAQPILIMLIAQYAWYGMFAGVTGLVPWHPTLSNYDAFGPLMVQGVGMCYWFAMGSKSPKVRLFLFALAAYCVLGVVASFARAAFLSLLAVVGWIWIRAPRKLVTGAAIGVGGILVVAGAALIFDPGFFYNEIMSAFEEGAEEGTGGARWELWKVGFKVWLTNPILGVGGGNFGAFAASHFKFGELEAFPNPNVLYGFNLHNAYMQVLSEFGLVGILALAWALWDFQKRNREIREPAAMRRWAEQNNKWDVSYLALGLEAANLANVLGGIFYASLFMPWFFTTWAANRMLWAVTRPPTEEKKPMRRNRGGPSPVRSQPTGPPPT